MRHPKGVASLVHFGCAKTRVDGERLLAQKVSSGWAIGSPEDADYIIVNTCAFINPAREESLREIERILARRSKIDLLISGCLPLWNLEIMRRKFPRASFSSMAGLKRLEERQSERLLTTYPYAFLKIAEGCNRKCSFCLIPCLRGHFRSLGADFLLKEARQLKARGIKELVLVAQDTTSYGMDLTGRPRLVELVKRVSELGFEWIRILYMYPHLVTRGLLRSFKALGNVLPYLDIPLQHSHPRILKLMGRGEKRGEPERILGHVREEWPEAALRSSFVVGFPGESEGEFEHLKTFILENKFAKLAIFPFYAEGRTEASRLPDQVPVAVREQRYEIIFQLQKDIYYQYNRELEGKLLHVLVDEKNGKWLHCRSFRDAPEIDGIVRVKAEGRVGDFLTVRVKKGLAYDLIGEIEQEELNAQESSN